MKIEIVIKNLRNEKPKQPWQIRVDRASILGNPFYMSSETLRDEVCIQYAKRLHALFGLSWRGVKKYYNTFKETYGIDKFDWDKMLETLYDLRTVGQKYKKLELFCWCAPKKCHAESIAHWIADEVEYDPETGKYHWYLEV